MIKFIPLGGADEIGASCYYLNIFGTGILLDSGIHPRKIGKEAIPDFDVVSNEPLDFVLLTHAHQDHIGSLPYLIKKYPHVKVYTTPQTVQIADITLHNAVRILSKRLTEEDAIEVYNHDEIDLLLRFIHDVPYNETIALRGLKHNCDEDIKITFYDAGHILGSASILLEINNQKIFYTGDINLNSQSIINGAELPGEKIDILITECTYGATDSKKLGTWHSEKNRFAKEANKVLSKGGSILIPVFALGKTQEMLSVIDDLINSGKLTDSYIYTGGIGKLISNVYDDNRYLIKRDKKNFEIKNISQINFMTISDLNYFKRKPGIVLASSGMMLKDTSSFKLAKYWFTQEDFAIYIAGYMDTDTPGFTVENSKKNDKIIFDDPFNPTVIKCEISRFYFTAHSKREELLGIVKKLKPVKVILVHGDSDSKSWLGAEILKNKLTEKLYSASLQKEVILS
ncbi:MAG: MBL fold metallo-hydrolase [Ignavibacteria bacterium]|jgi:Cft2 family RNA processing exonuclease